MTVGKGSVRRQADEPDALQHSLAAFMDRMADTKKNVGMKRQLPLLLVLLVSLVGCIPVDDLGAYWTKAGRDPRLAGTWRVVGGSLRKVGMLRGFSVVGDVYAASNLNDQGQPDDTRGPAYLKTLDVGQYHFLVFGALNTDGSGKRKGVMERYAFDGNTLKTCSSIGVSWVESVESHYPHAVNVKTNKSEGTFAVILRFDDEATRILSAIPDTDDYWECTEELVKVR